MLSIGEVISEVKKKGALIDAPPSLLIVYEESKGDGTPHIEIIDSSYYYISSERGYEIFREKAPDIDGLLYMIFNDITSCMANKFEVQNRIANQDNRRLAFAKKIELLGKIDSKWADIAIKETEKILQKYPYDDLSSERAKYSRKLRGQGLSEDEIEALAFSRYPPPR